jgi:hypothetical protein
MCERVRSSTGIQQPQDHSTNTINAMGLLAMYLAHERSILGGSLVELRGKRGAYAGGRAVGTMSERRQCL